MKHKIFIFIIIILFFNIIFSNDLSEILNNYENNSLEYKNIDYTNIINKSIFLNSFSYFLPKIYFYAQADSTSLLNDTYYSYGIRGSVPILNIPYLFQFASALKQKSVNSLLYEKNKYTLIINIINAYYNTIRSKYSSEILNDIFEYYKNILNKSKYLYENNIISQIDYLNIQSFYENIKYQKLQSEIDFHSYTTSLQSLIDIDINSLKDIPDTIPYFDTLLINDNLLFKNPDYLISKYALESAKHNAIASSSSFLPTLNFNMSASIKDTLFDFNYNNFKNNYDFSASISGEFPVFTGFSRIANTINSLYTKKSKQTEFLKTKNEIKNKIDNLKFEIEKSKALFISGKQRYESQKLIKEKSDRMFENGQLSANDYINALQNYIDSYKQYINAKQSMYITYYTYLYYLRRIK